MEDTSFLALLIGQSVFGIFQLERFYIQSHKDSIWSLVLSSDERHLVSGSWDGAVKIWEVGTSGELKELRTMMSDWFLSVAMSKDGRYIFTGDNDGTVKIWNYSTKRLERTLEGHEGIVYSVVVDPNNKYIVSCSAEIY